MKLILFLGKSFRQQSKYLFGTPSTQMGNEQKDS